MSGKYGNWAMKYEVKIWQMTGKIWKQRGNIEGAAIWQAAGKKNTFFTKFGNDREIWKQGGEIRS